MLCNKCNANNRPEARFCAKCGSPIAAPPFNVPQAGTPEDEVPQVDVPGDDIAQADVRQENIQPREVPQADVPPLDVPESDTPQAGIPIYTVPQYSVPEYGVPRYSVPQAGADLYSVPPGVYDIYERPAKKKSKLPLLIGIGALAAVLVIVFIFYYPFSFSKEPKNAMAAMYDGYKNLLASEGYDMSTKAAMNYDGENIEMVYDMSVLFGEDVLSSVFEYTMIFSSKEDNYWSRVAYTGENYIQGMSGISSLGGMFGMYGGGMPMPSPMPEDPDFYDTAVSPVSEGGVFARTVSDEPWEKEKKGINDPANYFVMEVKKGDIKDIFAEYENDFNRWYGVPIRINSLISENHINSELIIKYANNLLKGLEDEIGNDLYKALGVTRVPDINEIIAVYEYFVYEKCEEKGYTDKFLTDLKMADGVYEFTFNVRDFIDAFEEFLYDLEEDEKALDSLDVRSSTIGAMRKAVRLFSKEVWSMVAKEAGDVEFDMAVEIDKNRVLKSMSYSGDMKIDREKFSYEITTDITMVNDSKIDVDAINEFAAEVRAKGRDFGDINDPYKNFRW